MALLDVKGLNVEISSHRRALPALIDLSFSVDAGEILGIVGESGAGKSLAMDAIIGLIQPPVRTTSGEILLAGRRIDALGETALRKIRGKEIGVVFQDPMTSLNPLYSVGFQLTQTMRTHLKIRRNEARKRAIALLSDVGIPDPSRRFDLYPHQFSGGMRQRVVIALALCAGPRLVLADEPTTALDVSTQAQVLALLKQLCEEFQVAMVLISHDMGVIAETADRVAVMYAGRIVETAGVNALMATPRHPYTQALMSAVPTISQQHERLAQIEGKMPSSAAHGVACWLADERSTHG